MFTVVVPGTPTPLVTPSGSIHAPAIQPIPLIYTFHVPGIPVAAVPVEEPRTGKPIPPEYVLPFGSSSTNVVPVSIDAFAITIDTPSGTSNVTAGDSPTGRNVTSSEKESPSVTFANALNSRFCLTVSPYTSTPSSTAFTAA